MLFVMVWRIILLELGRRSKRLAERYQYIDPQIFDYLKSPLGSTDYSLAVWAVRKSWTTWSFRATIYDYKLPGMLQDTIHLVQSKSHCKLRK